MDKSWINEDRDTLKYQLGVENFLIFAEENASNHKRIPCPCSRCVNFKKKSSKVIRGHLYDYGFCLSYTSWIWHGEPSLSSCGSAPGGFGANQNHQVVSETVDMCQAAFNEGDYDEESFEFNKFVEDADRPLFENSERTKLESLVQLHNLKARFGMSDTCFSELLSTVGSLLPKDNVLPQSLYEAKKTLSNLGLQYEKIHACPNDCILYRKEFSVEITCPKCGLSRWKLKKDKTVKVGQPAKVLWYFPIIPRFKRLFKSADTAEMLNWHEDKRIKDGHMRHPADSPAWKLKKKKNPPFFKSLFDQVEINPWVPKRCKLLYKHATTIMKETGSSIRMLFSEEVFGEPTQLFILSENVINLLEMQWIGQGVIAAYEGYLHELITERDLLDTFAFVDPAATYNCGRPDFVRYLVDRLKEGKSDRIFFMPYNPGQHWILTILWEGEIYMLDPLPKPVHYKEWETSVMNAVKTFNAETGRANKLPKVKPLPGVPKQPGGVECGYYVMRYMKEIIEDETLSFPTKWAVKSRKSYTQAQIDEVRSEVADYIQSWV